MHWWLPEVAAGRSSAHGSEGIFPLILSELPVIGSIPWKIPIE